MKFLRVTFGPELMIGFHDISDIGSVVQIAENHWRIYFKTSNVEPVDCFNEDKDILEQIEKINSAANYRYFDIQHNGTINH